MTEVLARWGRFTFFTARLLRGAVTPPLFAEQVMRQSAMMCTRCLIPVVAVVFPFGMVLSLQGLAIFNMFGAQRMLSSLVALAVIRELSPILASVLVAAQGGSSCAAELGAMRIREELDATDVMAVDSLKYHAAPRLLALLIATPVLNTIGSFAGIVGSYVTAVFVKGENGGVFLSQLWTLTRPVDAWGGTLKTMIFGAIIGAVASWHGYNATGGAAGVGRAVNRTVVHSVVAFIVSNYFLSSALYGRAGQ